MTIDKFLEEFKNIKNEIKLPLIRIIETSDFSRIKCRFEYLLKIITSNQKDWLKKKISDFLKSGENQTKENFSGLLGEMMALGEIILAFDEFKLEMKKSGSDFNLNNNNANISIEVNTPQKTRSPKKTTAHNHGVTRHVSSKGEIKMELKTVAPCGYPTKPDYNIAYEAVQKFSQIKQEKPKQFSGKNISILWLDLNDPIDFGGFNMAEQCRPILAFRGSITSGAIWNAFYSKKGDRIYNSYTGAYDLGSEICPMEFNGRFYRQDNKIDFVIINAFTEKFIFQNPCSDKKFSNSLYRSFLRLYNVNLSSSFICLYDKNKLSEIIDIARSQNNGFYMALKYDI